MNNAALDTLIQVRFPTRISLGLNNKSASNNRLTLYMSCYDAMKRQQNIIIILKSPHGGSGNEKWASVFVWLS